MKKLNTFMEYFWLVAFIVSTFVVAYLLMKHGIDSEGLTLLLFPALAGFMYFARRFVRQKFEKNNTYDS
ncbi:MAG: hypothetical protein ACXITV_03520 [Luteibaculaceae bacterium]